MTDEYDWPSHLILIYFISDVDYISRKKGAYVSGADIPEAFEEAYCMIFQTPRCDINANIRIIAEEQYPSSRYMMRQKVLWPESPIRVLPCLPSMLLCTPWVQAVDEDNATPWLNEHTASNTRNVLLDVLLSIPLSIFRNDTLYELLESN
jgi:hypothetical protein